MASNFRKSFFSEARLLAIETLEIIRLIQRVGILNTNTVLVSHWLTDAINIYKNNPIFVNSYLLKSLKNKVAVLNNENLKKGE